MKNIKHSSTTDLNQQPSPASHAWTPKSLATIRTTARDFVNPVDYQHPYPSMAQFANHLALSYDANRTRHSYYRQVRLVHQHFGCDPATLSEAQLRDYFLFVKLKKHWTPKSIRQARAAASMFFVRLLGRTDWTVFSQVRTKDHDTLPEVLTRQQVIDLLAHIRLRRYRTPLKLIYCCGLRLSECLGLTIHDIKGAENKLILPHLQAAFRQHMYRWFKTHPWQPDPQVWRKTWGVHIQPAGSGASALNYLSAYVSRTAITNARMVRVDESSVTFRWKDRAHNNQTRLMTLPGVEFAARYLRHVLPAGLRSIRYYGFCHPRAKASRMRVQLHSGRAVDLGSTLHKHTDAATDRPLSPEIANPSPDSGKSPLALGYKRHSH